MTVFRLATVTRQYTAVRFSRDATYRGFRGCSRHAAAQALACSRASLAPRPCTCTAPFSPQAANRQVRGAEALVNVAELQAAHDSFVDETEDAANFVAK